MITMPSKLSATSVAALVLLSSVASAQEARKLILSYNEPARTAMNEALPIGNGRLGAMPFGRIHRERIVLNEDSLWTGGANPSGDYGNDFGFYQTLGDLLLTLEGAGLTVTSPGAQASANPTESIAASVDDDVATKWTAAHGGSPVVWQAATPAGAKAINAYSFTSGNDKPERDPRSWELAGSDDEQQWTTLDKRDDQPPFERRRQNKFYTFENAKAYRFYRLTFTAKGRQ